MMSPVRPPVGPQSNQKIGNQSLSSFTILVFKTMVLMAAMGNQKR